MSNTSISATAAVLRQVGGPFALESIHVAAPRDHEVRVRIVGAGMCHTDLDARDGFPVPMPIVLGHEGAGIVEQIGPGVTHLKPGDKVIGSLSPACGTCVMCREHKPFMCAHMNTVLNQCVYLDGTTRHKTLAGEDVHAMCALGSFGSHMVMPAVSAIRVPDDTPLESACLIGCGVTTGAGAALNSVPTQPGEFWLIAATRNVPAMM